MDIKILNEIGLTNSEIKVYLALLKLGSSKKGPIVKEAGITSSKIYEVIDKLVEKGLASFVVKERVRYFNAAPPSRIKDYLSEKEAKLKKQEIEFGEFLPQLELMSKLTEKQNDAEIYRGWKGMQTVYNDLLESLKPKEHYFVFGASKGLDLDKVKSFYTRFNEKAQQKKLVANIIFNEQARGNIPNVGKTGRVKFLNQTTPAEILIYANKTAIVLLEKEPLVILVRGESISESFKQYFDVLWKIANR